MADATTVAGLLTQRTTAGARYAAAVVELKASLVDLAGIDATLQSKKAIPEGGTQTFVDYPDSLPWAFSHPVYASRYPDAGQPVAQNWHSEVFARRNQLLAGLTG